MMNRSQHTQVHTQTHTPRQHRARCAGNLVEVKKTAPRVPQRNKTRLAFATVVPSNTRPNECPEDRRPSAKGSLYVQFTLAHSRLRSSRALASAAVCLLSRFAYSDFSAAGSGGKFVIMLDTPGSHRAVRRRATRRRAHAAARRRGAHTHHALVCTGTYARTWLRTLRR